MPKPLQEVAEMTGQVLVKASATGQGLAAAAEQGLVAGTVRIRQSADAPLPELLVKEVEQTPEVLDATLTREVIEEAIENNQKAEAEIAELKQQLQASQNKVEAIEQSASQLEAKLQVATRAEEALNNLTKLVGDRQQKPQTLEVLGTGSQELRNWMSLVSQSPANAVMHGGRQFVQRDTRAASAYLKQNHLKIREGIEGEMRSAGFLQGAGTIVANAPTLMADIPSSVFPYLAEFVRTPADRTLIYSQFARSYSVPGTAPRFQGQVRRHPYNPGPVTMADRILDPGLDIGTGRQNIVEDLVPVTIQELGLGKDANNAPISLTHFVQAFSLENLEGIVRRNLGRDYQRTKDLALRTLFFTANTVVYNGANRVVTAPGSVATGGIGHATRAYLRALRANMSTMQIPTFSNGCYVHTMTPNQVQYILDDLALQQRFPEPGNTAEMEMISRILQNEGEDYGGVVSGYRATVDGFMIFEQNVHSVGAAGTPGAQTETFGAGATLTETCFAFGADAVCWATALPVEIRQDEVTNFGRRDSWIWYSHENAAALDINEVVESGRITRERRVLQVRYSRDPVPA